MAPLEPAFKRIYRQPESSVNDKAAIYAIIANNFHGSSWLLAAALLQGILTWTFPTVITFLPALVILAYRTLDMLLIMSGVLPNRYMQGILPGKTSAQIPDETGRFGETMSSEKVVVIILASRSNHPLGILYPGYQKIVKYFNAMHEDLEKNRKKYGYLSSTAWISLSDPSRTAAREIMHIFYFKSIGGLNEFAHGAAHRAGWDWWNHTVKEHPDLSMMHELYEVPAGNWENIYLNYWPASFGSSVFPIRRTPEISKTGELEVEESFEKGTEGTEWIGGLIDASKASLLTSEQRMGRS
ncbi:hypothetical protein BGW36DRAFT_375998 [Talaromyces proteolyticus]|uniref:Monooxygenase n=1 Tax=Talaromyces proteolyticus TaxID=1131652 RepID=A0AAD4KTZ8_9EURO|nr:uncharacterized protein BGW36DRAFT_375998 [Talaromyces proteolyticus]KAH8698394.1 hypothetical protein BGW36DRAFT_375998 [Talaromyces proteolyticus]